MESTASVIYQVNRAGGNHSIMNKEVYFSERQRFRQLWLWGVLLGINVLIFYGLIQQIFLGQQFGDKPMSDGALIATSVLMLLLSDLFFYFRLETSITADGIYVRFFPLQLKLKFYPWDTIQQSFVREYNPLSEYGGWGMRGLGNNRALNISGNKGIQLIMQDGKKLLIGTKKADEATAILKRMGHLSVR